MSSFFKAPDGACLNSFHGIAASRGDGLHPLLLEAISKSGSVSGPPAKSETTDDNVISVEFGSQVTAATDNREAAK